jgi:hypothetical protein
VAEYCPSCFERADFLHICGESGSAGAFGGELTTGGHSLTSIVIAAPLMGVLLDLFLPLPSSLITSALIALLGSAFVAFLWVAFKFDGNKTFRLFFLNLKNFIYTPNMLKIFGSHGKKNVTSTWLGVIALSTAIQAFVFTPGNASFIEYSINNKIKKESGVNLQVECPGTQLFFYRDTIECRVKTGILGITVPARVTPSPILGTFKVKVSLL